MLLSYMLASPAYLSLWLQNIKISVSSGTRALSNDKNVLICGADQSGTGSKITQMIRVFFSFPSIRQQIFHHTGSPAVIFN